jgi:hypothetical protein
MEIAAALSGLKGAIDLAKTAIDARDDAKAKEAISNMMGLLFEANSSALAMSTEARRISTELDAATRELRDLKHRQTERDQYVLDQIARGRYVYKYVGDSSPTPAHYLCQNCFDGGGQVGSPPQARYRLWGRVGLCEPRRASDSYARLNSRYSYSVEAATA